jgi:hypothetical protein
MRTILHLAIGCTVLGAAFNAQAGPPLICHPYSIGDAKSLPWGNGPGWNDLDPSYNVGKLPADTLALLDQTSSVLVRMETLRRAAIYGSENHDVARALLDGLAQRESAAKPSALAYFDYGYFLSTLNQIAWLYNHDLSQGKDGYAIFQKALAIAPDSPEMHFAAAVMASAPSHRLDRDEHLKKARAAQSDALLARNLTTHFH